MARKLRVQYPGAIYHVMNRGDHSEAIFHDARDPEIFLRTLSQACGKTDWQVHDLRRKGDPDKIAIARRLRSETTMTWGWIAHQLSMGSPGAVANLLRKQR